MLKKMKKIAKRKVVVNELLLLALIVVAIGLSALTTLAKSYTSPYTAPYTPPYTPPYTTPYTVPHTTPYTTPYTPPYSPPKISNLQILSTSTNSVTLAWEQAANIKVKTYNIYRTSNINRYSLQLISSMSPSSYTDYRPWSYWLMPWRTPLKKFTNTGLQAGTTYTYYIRYIDDKNRLSNLSVGAKASTKGRSSAPPR